jgi:hypothetical protein
MSWEISATTSLSVSASLAGSESVRGVWRYDAGIFWKTMSVGRPGGDVNAENGTPTPRKVN